MPLRPCLEPGCPRLVRKGRCRKHRERRAERLNAERRASLVRRIYSDVRWLRARARALRRAGGRCQGLRSGARCPARNGLHGHHNYPGGVEQMLVDGADPFDERWIVVLCDSCHGRLEARLRARARAGRR